MLTLHLSRSSLGSFLIMSASSSVQGLDNCDRKECQFNVTIQKNNK